MNSEPTPTDNPPVAPPIKKQTRFLRPLVAGAGLGVVVLVFIICVVLFQQHTAPKQALQTQGTTAPTVTIEANPEQNGTAQEPQEQVSHTKLPLGDNKYATSPKKGYIYLCRTQMDGGGAFQAGPWINQATKTWDLTRKVTVDGNVSWANAQWRVSINGTQRMLTGNGLPYHTTGVYPIASSDDAYQYDRNPNALKTQNYSLTFPTNPTELATPECVGGEVGIMLSGVPLFNGFDAGGRDAEAWEVQDHCSGHPQESGMYHYHGPSSCIKDDTAADQHSALEGYALDGFGIYGVKGEGGKELTSNDLDECHGHTHEIIWDGKKVVMYHYHLTYDFPYSVGCFRGKKQVQGPLGGTAESGIMQRHNAGVSGRMPPPGSGQMPPPGMLPQ